MPATAAGRRWSGFTGFGTPVQIDEKTVAIIERRNGLAFALWHLDLAEMSLKFIIAVNENPRDNGGFHNATGYDEIVWHDIDSEIVGEFLIIHAEQTEPKRFTGRSLIGEINLVTGATKVKVDKIKHAGSEEAAIAKLLDKRRTRESVIQPDSEEAKKLVEKSLAARGAAFDYTRGLFVMAPAAREQLKRDVDRVIQSGDFTPAELMKLQRAISKLPACPATRELAKQVQACLE